MADRSFFQRPKPLLIGWGLFLGLFGGIAAVLAVLGPPPPDATPPKAAQVADKASAPEAEPQAGLKAETRSNDGDDTEGAGPSEEQDIGADETLVAEVEPATDSGDMPKEEAPAKAKADK
ncbi:MAG: hypothetical protein AAF679_14785, partial [Pseudomonadota bacterium]